MASSVFAYTITGPFGRRHIEPGPTTARYDFLAQGVGQRSGGAAGEDAGEDAVEELGRTVGEAPVVEAQNLANVLGDKKETLAWAEPLAPFSGS